MKEIYNLDHLVKIEVIPKRQDTSVRYQREVKFLGFRIWEEGFYFLGSAITQNDIDNSKELLREGVKLFKKPRVLLYFSNGHVKANYFDTFGLANKWAYEIASKNITSKLEIKY